MMKMLPTPVPSCDRLIHQIFGSEIAVAEMDPRDADPSTLLLEERNVIVTAAPKRKLEFAAGRQVARSAMRQLGVNAPTALIPDQNRVPSWPIGIVGSISHTDVWVAAAAARAGDICSVGCDVELDSVLEPALWKLVCTHAELAWMASYPAVAQGALAKLIFSAKECTYKAQYPLTCAFMDFSELSLTIDSSNGLFHAVFQHDVGRFKAGASLTGAFVRERGLIGTAMTITRANLDSLQE